MEREKFSRIAKGYKQQEEEIGFKHFTNKLAGNNPGKNS